MTTPGSITDIPGILVGHAQRIGDGYLTGTTVVLTPEGTLGGIDVRGGGPATHETDLLDPRTMTTFVDAIVLTGGSAYGLVTAHGAQRWLAEHGRGVRVGPDPSQVVPIVPAAAIFDLGRGGQFEAQPEESWGYEAAAAAANSVSGTALARGNVGAGTGAAIGHQHFKGGIGTASIRLHSDTDLIIGALAVVNAHGFPLWGNEGEHTASAYAARRSEPAGPLNTTISVVATNAALDVAETSRLATVAHDGYARALEPAHTLLDGDTIFSLATGGVELPPPGSPERLAVTYELHARAAEVMRLAILDGIRQATGITEGTVNLPANPQPTADD